MKTSAILAVALFVINLQLHAQSVEERLTAKKPTCREVLANAASVLPELYAQKAFDSLEKAIDIIHNACLDVREVFYLRTLYSIERPSILLASNMDSDFMDKLNTYAARVAVLKNRNPQFYDADEYKLISFIKQWATDLLTEKNLSAEVRYLCNVFAGNINNPEKELRANKDEYPELYALLQQGYINERNSGGITSAFIVGTWMPTKDLKVLGNHPSVGISFGGRTVRDELDFALQFRFVNSKNSYDVLRQNTLYSRDAYFGGYIGVDYIRYIIHKTGYELGWLAGAGYDGFDITSFSDGNYNTDYLKPLSINSFNFNTGLRFNYFFNARGFIGLQSRYNFINYGNKGGTSLRGDAISIDLLFGIAHKAY